MKSRRAVKKPVRSFFKRPRTCRKPIRRAANTGRKTDSLFDMMGLDTETLFGMTAKKAAAKLAKPADGGWIDTFAKLNIRSIVSKIANQRRSAERARAKYKAYSKSRQKAWAKEWKNREQLEKKMRAEAVTVKDKRAEELALIALHPDNNNYRIANLAARFVNRSELPLENQIKWLSNIFDSHNEGRIRSAGDASELIKREGSTLIFYNYRKGHIERLPIRDFIEIAKRIVQSGQRPKWMTTVGTDKAALRREEKKRKEYERKLARDRIKWDREAKKRQAQYAAMVKAAAKPPTKAQLKQIEKEKKERLEYQRKVQTERARQRANDAWANKMAVEVSAMIRQKMKRKPEINEIAEVINAGLEKRGLKQTDLTPGPKKKVPDFHVYSQFDGDKQKETGKLLVRGVGAMGENLIPGAPEPVVKLKEDEDSDE